MAYSAPNYRAASLSAEERARIEQIATRLDTARSQLESAYTNFDTLTPEQREQALKTMIRTVAALCRLVLYQLDSSGV
jgi:hypothetical protein